MQTSLLTLNSTSVAGQEASLLQRRAISRVVDIQGTSNGKAKSTSLTGGATTGEVCMNVELTFTINQYQRRLDQLLVQFVREVIFQGTTVADDLTGTSGHANTNDGALAATNSLNRLIQLGGSRNNGFFFNFHSHGIGDGTLTGLALMSRMAETGLPLKTLAEAMTVLPQVLINVPVSDKAIIEKHPVVVEAIQRAEGELGDSGRVLLRASGTEELFRVMVEAADAETARKVAGRLAAVVAEV